MWNLALFPQAIHFWDNPDWVLPGIQSVGKPRVDFAIWKTLSGIVGAPSSWDIPWFPLTTGTGCVCVTVLSGTVWELCAGTAPEGIILAKKLSWARSGCDRCAERARRAQCATALHLPSFHNPLFFFFTQKCLSKNLQQQQQNQLPHQKIVLVFFFLSAEKINVYTFKKKKKKKALL